jgi:hypothetical protein
VPSRPARLSSRLRMAERVLKPLPHTGKRLCYRCDRGWACAARKLAAAPLHATTFDNISSQRVAQRLSLSPVASEFSVNRQLIPWSGLCPYCAARPSRPNRPQQKSTPGSRRQHRDTLTAQLRELDPAPPSSTHAAREFAVLRPWSPMLRCARPSVYLPAHIVSWLGARSIGYLEEKQKKCCTCGESIRRRSALPIPFLWPHFNH